MELHNFKVEGEGGGTSAVAQLAPPPVTGIRVVEGSNPGMEVHCQTPNFSQLDPSELRGHDELEADIWPGCFCECARTIALLMGCSRPAYDNLGIPKSGISVKLQDLPSYISAMHAN